MRGVAFQSNASAAIGNAQMKIAFRTDSSLEIGTGHVMRCLTLAEALKAKGANCEFLCRDLEGSLINLIRVKGFVVHVLSSVINNGNELTLSRSKVSVNELPHSSWLGSSQVDDSNVCAPILDKYQPDWMVVDHYALDINWELATADYCDKLMVIDDLADRQHGCDLLLDQTFGRLEADYQHLLNHNCRLLCGSRFALLRPEFSLMRPYSLSRRTLPNLRKLLISMSGVDKNNVTGQILTALSACSLPDECSITVVMGATSPWVDKVMEQAVNMPHPTRVLVGVSNMAQLMSDCDLAIGAAGSTSWERCCLGVPSILVILANNQHKVAKGLADSGAATIIPSVNNLETILRKKLNCFIGNSYKLALMSKCASDIVDGSGLNVVLQEMGV